MRHPDDDARYSWAAYQERIAFHGFPRYPDYTGHIRSNAAIARSIAKLAMTAIPQYRQGPMQPKNHELHENSILKQFNP